MLTLSAYFMGDAAFWLGRCYQFGNGCEKDDDKAQIWYNKAKESNNTKAEKSLMYFYNKEKHNKSAMRTYILNKIEEKQEKNQNSLYNIALRYNECVDDDSTKKCISYLMKAADGGNIDSQYHLGIYYYTGDCIEQDREKAKELFTSAANNGHEMAQIALNEYFNSNE